MAANIVLPVPTWARIAIVLVALAAFVGSVVGVWFGNVYALAVVIPSSILACKAVRFAFNR